MINFLIFILILGIGIGIGAYIADVIISKGFEKLRKYLKDKRK